MKFILILLIPFLFSSCKITAIPTESADIQETAQQIGDVMASVDEVGGAGGNIASNTIQNSIEKTFNRYAPGELDESHKSMIANILQPKANAASCSGVVFSCIGRVLTRTFNGCTIGSAVFNGTVRATWGGGGDGTSCSLGTIAGSATITRVPDFEITGRRGAVLEVTQVGTIGQRLTWTTGTGTNPKTFSFTNDGINRKFTLPDTTVLFNQTSTTTLAIGITGASRANRVMNGGSLLVRNNITNSECTYIPDNVTWTTGCNCPTSGTWNGTCDGGAKTSTLVLNSICGQATYTEGTDTQSITLDRCGT